MSATRQIAIGEQAPPTWTDLQYAGDANGIAIFLATHPATKANVQVCYDRQTGGTGSKPACPALEPLARFATLVLDAHRALRECRFTDRQLAGLLETSELLARANRGDEQWQADLEGVRREVRRRAERQGGHHA